MSEEPPAGLQNEDVYYPPAGDGNKQFLQQHPGAEQNTELAHYIAGAIDNEMVGEKEALKEAKGWENSKDYVLSNHDVVMAKTNQRIQEANVRAADYRNDAASIENWARILYEHPISEDYLARYPNVNFDPPHVMWLERNMDWQVDQAAAIEQLADNLQGMDILWARYAGSQKLPSLAELVRHIEDDAGLNANWQKLIGSPDTTIPQLRNFYAEALKRKYSEPLRNEANIKKAVLEDIRSGRASGNPSAEEPHHDNSHSEKES